MKKPQHCFLRPWQRFWPRLRLRRSAASEARRRAILLCCAGVAGGWLGGCSKKTETPLSEKAVVSRSQPAVFKVLMVGTIHIQYPRYVWTKKDCSTVALFGGLTPCGPLRSPRAIVKNEYERDRASGVLDMAATEASYSWEKVASDPGKYLEVSTILPASLPAQYGVYGHGSGFVVSREGTMLTNAHLLEPPDKSILYDADSAYALLHAVMDQVLANLSAEFGGPPPREESIRWKLLHNLVPWFGQFCTVTGEQDEVRVVMDERILGGGSRQMTLSELLARLNKPSAGSVPGWKLSSLHAKVLGSGEPWPGKDVAVLQLEGIPKDRLICLLLGESDEGHLPNGTKVIALGFPGAAVAIPGVEEDESHPRVISHNGIVDQRMRTKKDWYALHMTAETNHGDSGGPVVDEYGKVVGINVAGNPRAPAQNLAVPIDMGKELLKLKKITLDPGPLTEHWLAGQDAFWRQSYGTACKEFKKVAEMESGANPSPKLGSMVNKMSDADRYVKIMMEACEKRTR